MALKPGGKGRWRQRGGIKGWGLGSSKDWGLWSEREGSGLRVFRGSLGVVGRGGARGPVAERLGSWRVSSSEVVTAAW